MTGDSVTGIGIDGSATARLNIFPGSRNMTSISSADEGRGYGHVHMAPLLEDDRKVIQGHSSGELFGCLLEPPQDLGRSNFVNFDSADDRSEPDCLQGSSATSLKINGYRNTAFKLRPATRSHAKHRTWARLFDP
ncbi:LOW QUALITY PROTEIN: hypothetical protein ACO22_07957 [Paracoccidioides brasiliensis]|uniref:Uncharacterized protein n=1 Tax=Paracoccidioides brasiliensis TaxID=121759 RepID=A0A1D2J3L4_PARBR|nr:LOW QUALITY PROTEIN: hypothetical protein ACO22_07957 [Paracoccidioides brasiliensis]